MKKEISVKIEKPVVHLSTEIIYGHRVAWAGVDYRQLKVSLLKPRTFFNYDPTVKSPLLVFICGGGFSEIDRNAWIPDMVWYADHGYIVACIDYTVTARMVYPMQIQDIKAAIRFLRAHSEEFCIDSDRVFVMGESAGGYLAGLTALSDDSSYSEGDNLNQSNKVKAAVCIYPAVDMTPLTKSIAIPREVDRYPNLQDLVSPTSPPVMILQGKADTVVDYTRHSDLLYEAMERSGIRCDYYLIEGANHADAHFSQDETKQLVLDFMNSIV